MLSIQSNLFYFPKEKKSQAEAARQSLVCSEGDHLTLLNIWKQWAAENYSSRWCFENFIQIKSMKTARDIRDQIFKLAEKIDLKLSSTDNHVLILKAILSGYFFQAACVQKTGETYRTVKHGLNMFIHPGSVLKKINPPWVMYHELVLTSKEYMRQVSEIQSEWLLEIAPHYFKGYDLDLHGLKKTLKSHAEQ